MQNSNQGQICIIYESKIINLPKKKIKITKERKKDYQRQNKKERKKKQGKIKIEKTEDLT